MNVNEPKFITSPATLPSVIPVPLKLALLVTVTFAVASLVIPAVESNTKLFAVLVPLSNVLESSRIETAPGELNVSEPKFSTSPATLPSVILVPLRLALLVTVTFAVASLVIAAVEASTKLFAMLVPLSNVLESS